jgi:acyl phosphate:glycerol-3-phosphate acyltransferase
LEIAILILSYLLGSLPSGYFLVKYSLKEDIRESGSGMVGATNVERLLGKKGFYVTFFIDFIKSILLVYLIGYYFDETSQFFAIFGITLGHIYPLFLKFKGGKGIAVATGGLLGYSLIFTLILIGTFLIINLKIKKFTISGLFALIIAPFIYYFAHQEWQVLIFMMILNLLILFAHRENIRNYFNE